MCVCKVCEGGIAVYVVLTLRIVHSSYDQPSPLLPGGGCARRPVGTYLYLHAVGVGNPHAVPSLAW
jgi:hypothetical protein